MYLKASYTESELVQVLRCCRGAGTSIGTYIKRLIHMKIDLHVCIQIHKRSVHVSQIRVCVCVCVCVRVCVCVCVCVRVSVAQ